MADVNSGVSDAESGALADRLRRLGDDAGVTQREVAETAGIAYRTYQRYVAGGTVPADALARIVTRFGVSGHWLLIGEGEMYPPEQDQEKALLDRIMEVLESEPEVSRRLLAEARARHVARLRPIVQADLESQPGPEERSGEDEGNHKPNRNKRRG